jgi:hypothetical protein
MLPLPCSGSRVNLRRRSVNPTQCAWSRLEGKWFERGVDLDVLVFGVKYDGAIEVEESVRLAPGTEFKWYRGGR